MKCSRCGHEFDSENVFCPKCGGYIFTKAKRSIEHIDNAHFQDLYRYKSNNATANRKLNKEMFSEISATASDLYEEDEMTDRGKSGIKTFFIGFFVVILLLGAAFFAGYYAYNRFMGNSSTEYLNQVKKLNSDIASANNSMVQIIKKDANTFPASDILKHTYNEFDTFNKIIGSYEKIIAPSNYSDSHQKLGEAIKLNKTVYQQLEIILKNPVHPDIKKNMESLTNSIDSCMDNYSQVKISGISFSLPDEILSISSKLQPWIKQKQNEYSQIASLIASFSKYFEDMAKLFTTYDSAGADFNQLIKSVRNGQEKWEKLFSQIDNSEKIVKGVKASYEKLSVPSELKTINKRFGPILDEQLSYYTKLRQAAQMEKEYKSSIPSTSQGTTTGSNSQSGTSTGANPKTSAFVPKQIPKKESDINLLYQEAEKIAASASSNYQKFAIDLKAEKDKYLDPEFVLKLKSGK